MNGATMTEDEQAAIADAMQQLEDCVSLARGCETLDPDECGVTPLEQVEITRAAMREAGQVLTKWRRRLTRASGTTEKRPKDDE